MKRERKGKDEERESDEDGGEMGKSNFSSEEERGETSPSILHEYRKCRELQTIKLPTIGHKGKTTK